MIVLALVLAGVGAALFVHIPTSTSSPQTPTSHEPVTLSTNEITLFPTGPHLGSSFFFTTWTLAVVNNSNETQRMVASLFESDLPGDFQSIALNSSQSASQTNCEGFARNGTSYSVSVIVTSAEGSVNFTVPVTMKVASPSPFTGQVKVANTLLNTSVTFPSHVLAATEWNMTVENSGQMPIVFFHAALYDPNATATPANSTIFNLSSCPYPQYNFGQSQTVSLQSPLAPGQSISVSSPTFTPGVTPGKTYNVDYAIGFSDGTCVIFTTSVRAE